VTTDAAVIGLTYDATDLQEADLGIFLEIVRGLSEPPAVRGVDTVVPSLAFRVPRARIADYLVLELRGFVRGEGADEEAQRSDVRDKIDTLRALFDPAADPADLVATCEDGTIRTISCRTLSIVYADVLPTHKTLSVELEAYEDWQVSGS